MKVDDLFNEISETVESGHKLFIFKKRIVDGEAILALVEEAKEALPKEFDICQNIINDRDEIIDSAKKKGRLIIQSATTEATDKVDEANRTAQSTVENAEAEANRVVAMADTECKRLVSESNIVHTAQEEASRIVLEARQEAERIFSETKRSCDEFTGQAVSWANGIKKDAYDYVVGIIRQADSFLSASSSNLNDSVSRLNTVKNSLDIEYTDQQSKRPDGYSE